MNETKIENQLKSLEKVDLEEVCRRMLVKCGSKDIIIQLLKPLKRKYIKCRYT